MIFTSDLDHGMVYDCQELPEGAVADHIMLQVDETRLVMVCLLP